MDWWPVLEDSGGGWEGPSSLGGDIAEARKSPRGWRCQEAKHVQVNAQQRGVLRVVMAAGTTQAAVELDDCSSRQEDVVV